MLATFDSIIWEMISACKNCGQCNITCQTHEFGLFNPLGLLRDLEMNGESLERVIKNQSIFNCMACNRCMSYCPMHASKEGIDMAHLIRELRHYAFENEIIAKNQPDFPGCGSIIHGIKKSEINNKSSKYPKSQKTPKNLSKIGILHYFKGKSELKIAKTGEIAYFIDDLPQLQKQYPEYGDEVSQIPRAVVKILNHINITPVVINMKGSGHDDLWIGDYSTFKALAEYNVKTYRKAHVKIVVIENDEAYHTWKYEYPRFISDFDFKVYHLSEFLMDSDFLKKAVYNFPINVSFTYHDSSKLGRMGGEIYEQPRKILQGFKGTKLIELENNREFALEFGCSPFLQVNENTKRMWIKFVKEVRETGAQYFITTNSKIIAHYNYVIDNLIKEKDHMHFPIVKDWALFLERFLR
ncbi:MAG: (Fe-S)-binding protein [Promethearchaeota archaeon]